MKILFKQYPCYFLAFFLSAMTLTFQRDGGSFLSAGLLGAQNPAGHDEYRA